MSWDGNPPIRRGMVETNSGVYDNILGREFTFTDLNYSASGVKTARTKMAVRCRVVRNDSGFTLLPKRLVRFSTTAGEYNQVVDGYVASTNERGYPVDEFIPSSGVPDGAYFLIVVAGPANILVPIANTEFNGSIAVGDVMVALTAATSGATTAGRLNKINITGSSQATDYTAIMFAGLNMIGRALSASSTNNTAGTASILVDVGKW